jgi:hypothetical protein
MQYLPYSYYYLLYKNLCTHPTHTKPLLTENRVVHELEEILLELVGGLLAHLSVAVDVAGHEVRLLELDRPVNLLEHHTLLEVELEISDVADVPLLGHQIGH